MPSRTRDAPEWQDRDYSITCAAALAVLAIALLAVLGEARASYLNVLI